MAPDRVSSTSAKSRGPMCGWRPLNMSRVQIGTCQFGSASARGRKTWAYSAATRSTSFGVDHRKTSPLPRSRRYPSSAIDTSATLTVDSLVVDSLARDFADVTASPSRPSRLAIRHVHDEPIAVMPGRAQYGTPCCRSARHVGDFEQFSESEVEPHLTVTPRSLRLTTRCPGRAGRSAQLR